MSNIHENPEVSLSTKLLSAKLGIQIPPNQGQKFAKSHILKSLGFKSEHEAFSHQDIKIASYEDSKKVDLNILSQLTSGNFLTVRFINDQGASSGGYPIIYTDNPDHYQSLKTYSSSGRLAGWRTSDDTEVKIEDRLVVQLFPQKKSPSQCVSSLDNYPSPQIIRLGGGFRIQLDSVDVESPGFGFYSTILFNHYGPRALSLSNSFYNSIPRATIQFTASQTPESLTINPITDKYSNDARNINRKIIQQLFAQDGKAISALFNALMDINPLPQHHSLEGVYTFTNGLKGPAKLRVIDFDGADTLEHWLKKSNTTFNPSATITAVQILTQAHLALMRRKLSPQ